MAATSNLAKMFDAARTIIATSATFQTWTGDAVLADAKAHVHVAEIPADKMVDAEMPRVRLDLTDWGSPATGTGGAQVLFNGVLRVLFVDAFNPSGDPEAQKEAFNNNVGGVLEDLMALSDGDGEHLFIRDIKPEEPIRFPDETEDAEGKRIEGAYQLMWGVDDVSSG